ncbi:uncharacterized protein LY89DRAFT_719937 [Mollisia scopiformis]|uniref:Death domain-containing protein n=1 Tax=Mollisia scopiformis TaxID=149040 RepID=A0A194X5L8_MOLSC|nr:uncharacterized protein LY89DRAFT_719937 [Mollisia scopiformis]KUJ15374.1 hypothetical protein LY89DRAFT_719937 [Mollisia scopiformis]
MSCERLKAVHKFKGLFRSRSRSTASDKSTESQGTSNDNVPSRTDDAVSPAPVIPTTASTDTTAAEPDESKKASSEASPPETDIWKLAYERLTKEKPSLVEHYEQILAQEEADSSAKSQDSPENITNSITRLTDLASKKLAHLDDSRLKIRLRSKTFVVKDGVDQVLEIVVAAKDFVSGIVASDPHVAIAWTGVCVLLPLLLNPKAQYDDASAGLLEIPLIIRRYQVLEPLYQRRSAENESLKGDFERKLTDLYCTILEYQARAVCQWSRDALHQYGRDVFKADSWAKLFKEIKDQDSACKEIATTLDAGLWEKTLQTESRHLQEILQSWQEEERKTLQDLQESMRKLHGLAEDRQTRQLSIEQQKEEADCHQSFGPMDYRDHKDQNPSRVPGTCTWFLEHRSFLEWKQETNSALLWVSADPGCGKSVLMKSLVDEGLLGKVQSRPRFATSSRTDLSANKNPYLIQYALPDFRRDRRAADNFSVVWDILVKAASASEAGELVCVLDALDECEEKAREQLIEHLKRLYLDQDKCQGMKLKFLVSSRPYPIIERRFRALIKDFPSIHLKGEQESDTISEEINLVIQKRVPEIAVDPELSPEAQQSLLENLLSVQNRTYLWLHLIFEAILKSLGATSAKGLAKIIKQLPESVDEAYDKILAKASDPQVCRKLLHIILAAREPLSIAQVNVALHVDESATCVEDLDLEADEYFEKTVRGLCGFFVSVVGKKVFLIHQTAREYLQGNSPETSNLKHSFPDFDSETIFARSCIVYLQYADFRLERPSQSNDDDEEVIDCADENIDIDEELDTSQAFSKVHFEPPLALQIKSLADKYPFFGYAAINWAAHFEVSAKIELLKVAMPLCDPKSEIFLAWFNYYIYMPRPAIFLAPDAEISSLMVAVRLSSGILIEKFLSEINHTTTSGVTALMIAAYSSTAECFAKLFQSGANAEASDRDGWRAIRYAICAGSHAITYPLVTQGVDLNCASKDGTPLVLTVYGGHNKIVQHLCKHGARINEVSRGRTATETALCAAVRWNHLDVAKTLLELGADLTQEFDGSNVFEFAISTSNMEALKLLLQHKPELYLEAPRLALTAAIKYGDSKAVKIILWYTNLTPSLLHAAQEDIVRILQEGLQSKASREEKERLDRLPEIGHLIDIFLSSKTIIDNNNELDDLSEMTAPHKPRDLKLYGESRMLNIRTFWDELWLLD